MTDRQLAPSRAQLDGVITAAVDPHYLQTGAPSSEAASFAERGLSKVEIDWIVVAVLVAFGVELSAAQVASCCPANLGDKVRAAQRDRFS